MEIGNIGEHWSPTAEDHSTDAWRQGRSQQWSLRWLIVWNLKLRRRCPNLAMKEMDVSVTGTFWDDQSNTS